MGRLSAETDELVGAAVYLCSDGRFVRYWRDSGHRRAVFLASGGQPIAGRPINSGRKHRDDLEMMSRE